ncbi:DUF6545 domain-containing protein [Streptomyces sp. NPDC048550]|uniref:DUF6545 domain-containing protein n=1 Tax=Streptomyces sp. NPDC048550 TaxID=3155739 RepID=UPI003416D20F
MLGPERHRPGNAGARGPRTGCTGRLLQSLWRDLALAIPDLVRHASSRNSSGASRHGPPRHRAGPGLVRSLAPVRPGRDVTEIRDGRHPRDVPTRPRRPLPARSGIRRGRGRGRRRTGQDAEAATQAYWIMAACPNMWGSGLRAGRTGRASLCWRGLRRRGVAVAAPRLRCVHASRSRGRAVRAGG